MYTWVKVSDQTAGTSDTTYSILVAQEASVVKPSVSIRHAEGQTWSGSVRQVVVNKVQVIRSEVDVAEGRVCWHSETSRARASQAGVQRRRNGQGRSVGVIV